MLGLKLNHVSKRDHKTKQRNAAIQQSIKYIFSKIYTKERAK